MREKFELMRRWRGCRNTGKRGKREEERRRPTTIKSPRASFAKLNRELLQQ